MYFKKRKKEKNTYAKVKKVPRTFRDKFWFLLVFSIFITVVLLVKKA